MDYHLSVKLCVTIAAFLVSGCIAFAQTNDPDLTDMLDAAQQWVQGNLDEDVLRVLQDVDQAKIKESSSSGFRITSRQSIIKRLAMKRIALTIIAVGLTAASLVQG